MKIKYNILRIVINFNKLFFYSKNKFIISFFIWYGTLPLPRTPVMYAIISLHDHILFIMCMILTLVIYLLITTLLEYTYLLDNKDDSDTYEYFKQLEFDEKIKYWENSLLILLNKIPSFFHNFIISIWSVYWKCFFNLRNFFLSYFTFKIIKDKNFNIKLINFIKETIWSKKLYSWLNISHCTWLEIYWTLIPCILLALIAIPSFWLLYAFDEIIDPAITIKVIGHQWYWSYEMSDFNDISMHWAWMPMSVHPKIKYDSYLLDVNDLKLGDFRLLKTTIPLILPKDLHIRILVTSDDVLHSFSVPAFGIKVDAVPGRLNQISLFIKDTGIFFGQCSESCGANHGFMPIEVLTFSPRHYYWLLYDTIIYPNRWWYFPSDTDPKWQWKGGDIDESDESNENNNNKPDPKFYDPFNSSKLYNEMKDRIRRELDEEQKFNKQFEKFYIPDKCNKCGEHPKGIDPLDRDAKRKIVQGFRCSSSPVNATGFFYVMYTDLGKIFWQKLDITKIQTPEDYILFTQRLMEAFTQWELQASEQQIAIYEEYLKYHKELGLEYESNYEKNHNTKPSFPPSRQEFAKFDTSKMPNREQLKAILEQQKLKKK